MSLHRRAMLRSTLAGFGALTMAPWVRGDDDGGTAGSILAEVQQVPRSDKARFMISGLISIDPKSAAWTQVADRIGSARLSPDGKRLARTEDGGLQVGALDGEPPSRTVFKPDEGRVSSPIWAADGRSILVTLSSGARDSRKRRAVWVATDGSGVREAPLPPNCFVTDCSRDGRLLALVQSDPPRDPKTLRARQSLVILSPDGKEVRRIVTDTAGMPSRFSPDGGRILLTTQSPDGNDVWIEPVDGGDRTRIKMDGIWDVNACWAPDGRHLAVTRFRLTRVEGGRLTPDLGQGGVHSRLEVVATDGQPWRTLPLPDGLLRVLDWR